MSQCGVYQNVWFKLETFFKIAFFFQNYNFCEWLIQFNPYVYSLASFLWDIGKQNSPRWDAAKRGVPSGANMKLRHCLLSDTESETYMAQYTISYDVINKRKKLPNLILLQTGQPSHNLNKL